MLFEVSNYFQRGCHEWKILLISLLSKWYYVPKQVPIRNWMFCISTNNLPSNSKKFHLLGSIRFKTGKSTNVFDEVYWVPHVKYHCDDVFLQYTMCSKNFRFFRQPWKCELFISRKTKKLTQLRAVHLQEFKIKIQKKKDSFKNKQSLYGLLWL